MKKINLNLTKNLSEKKLSETQMDELLGGFKCPICQYDFEPDDVGDSIYTCSGIDRGIYKTTTIEAYSAGEAEAKLMSEGWIEVSCGPGDGYNVAPGF